MPTPKFPASSPDADGDPLARGWGDDEAQKTLSRPTTLLIGCILAWVGTPFGIVSGALMLGVDRSSSILKNVADSDLDKGVTFFHILGVVLVVWCLTVAVLAYFAFRGASWAAFGLLVMGVVFIGVSIFNALGGAGQAVVPGAIWVIASVTLIYVVSQSREWIRQQGRLR